MVKACAQVGLRLRLSSMQHFQFIFSFLESCCMEPKGLWVFQNPGANLIDYPLPHKGFISGVTLKWELVYYLCEEFSGWLETGVIVFCWWGGGTVFGWGNGFQMRCVHCGGGSVGLLDINERRMKRGFPGWMGKKDSNGVVALCPLHEWGCDSSARPSIGGCSLVVCLGEFF